MNTTGLNKLVLTDLLPADVLLYDIQNTFGRIVSAFDTAGFNHAALYLGQENVGEAVDEGVKSSPWNKGPWRSPRAVVLRSKVEDTLPFLHKAYEFIADGRRYGYGQILLAAGACFLRQSGVTDKFVKDFYATLIEMSAEFVESMHKQGRKPMICSEYVYRCFVEANPPYPISVDLFVDDPRSAGERDERLVKLSQLSSCYVAPGDLYRAKELEVLGYVDVL